MLGDVGEDRQVVGREFLAAQLLPKLCRMGGHRLLTLSPLLSGPLLPSDRHSSRQGGRSAGENEIARGTGARAMVATGPESGPGSSSAPLSSTTEVFGSD